MKTTFSCTLNAVIRPGVGYVKLHIPIPYPPFQNFFYSNQRGARVLVPLIAMPVTVVQPGLSTGRQSEGAKRPSGGRVWEVGYPPTVGRYFFETSCMKTAFSCALNAIIRGSLCS